MNNCPDAETLGAFIDGALTGDALRSVTEHLATCEECMAVMSAARFRDETDDERKPVDIASHPRFGGRTRLAAIAAAVVVLAGLGALIGVLRSRADGGINSLIAASPSNWRTVEPRLSGFPWAELHKMRAGEPLRPDPESLQLLGAAGKVLHQSHDPHSTGVAELLVGQPAEAIERLRAATTSHPDDAKSWNDLAAAYVASAAQGKMGDLPEALAASDRALALNPSFAEALFNRALILERMGLRGEAVRAWRAYLAIDASSSWAAEARAHVQALESPAANNDPEASRKRYETEVLGRWGEKPDAAELTAAASFGERLRRTNGDALLTDAIAAIERQSDPRAIAAAHALYRRGRLHYHAHELAAAERDLLAAATAFERCGSPMRDVSRLYAASVMFDENRIDDAAAMFEQVIRDAPPEHRSLLAEARVQLGRCAMYEGRWSDAVTEFRDAAAMFRALGESANLAVAEAGLADAFDGLGDREESWSHRAAAFGVSGPKLLLALATASHCELRDQRLASAGALLRLEIDEARQLGAPLLIADAYKRLALLHARSGETGAAFADLREARTFLGRETDAGLRQRVEGECSIAEGVLLRGIDARRSVAQLTSAIGFLDRSGLRFAMSEALLERARSRRAAGDDTAANDFDAAFAELDREKNSETAAALREESVDFYLARGDVARAFGTAERSPALPVVPARTALLEYVPVTGGIAIFCVTRRGLDHVVVRGDRASLQAAIREVSEAMNRRSSNATPALAALHARLIAPVASQIADAASLVIVADRSLQFVPWAALYDGTRNEYLVERAAITIAPSAAVWMRNSRSAASRRGDRLLLIEAEEVGGKDEIAALAAMYPDHRLLAGAAATPEDILRAAGECDVLHFAGHARGESARGGAALLLRETELRASQIESLQLRRPRLAVLAACSTSAMAGAFLAAGVPAVVATLWPIEDAPASALFGEFHRRLRGGFGAAEALRDAQLAMIRGGGPGAHPAVWGGVEIEGGNS